MLKHGILVTFLIIVICSVYLVEKLKTKPENDASEKKHSKVIKEEIIKKRIQNHRGVNCVKEDIFLSVFTCDSDDICLSKERLTKKENASSVSATIIVLLLIISSVKSIVDVVNAKQSEKTLAIDGKEIRRESLAEFANKKKPQRLSKTASESLTEMRPQKCFGKTEKVEKVLRRAESATAWIGETNENVQNETVLKLSENNSPKKQQLQHSTIVKLIGARPPGMLRRSSVPAMSLFETNSTTLRRQSTTEADGELTPDDRHKRVRILRRF